MPAAQSCVAGALTPQHGVLPAAWRCSMPATSKTELFFFVKRFYKCLYEGFDRFSSDNMVPIVL